MLLTFSRKASGTCLESLRGTCRCRSAQILIRAQKRHAGVSINWGTYGGCSENQSPTIWALGYPILGNSHACAAVEKNLRRAARIPGSATLPAETSSPRQSCRPALTHNLDARHKCYGQAHKSTKDLSGRHLAWSPDMLTHGMMLTCHRTSWGRSCTGLKRHVCFFCFTRLLSRPLG